MHQLVQKTNRQGQWTGGQYSLFRVIFGVYLTIHFTHLVPWGAEIFSNQGVLPDRFLSPLMSLFPGLFLLNDSPLFVTASLCIGAVAAVAFTIGYRDRIAAILIWFLLASLFVRNPLIANPSLPWIGWLLLAHAAIPGTPYGALDARGRVDPRGAWSMPQSLFVVAWILMALSYTYSGYYKLFSVSWIDGTAIGWLLENPLARDTWIRTLLLSQPSWMGRMATWGGLALEVGFVLFLFFRSVRPLAWLLMLLMHINLIVLVNFADLSFGMVILHLFTFNPDWVRPKAEREPAILFYDGDCGLCHRFLRFVIAEDRRTTPMTFAPLFSEKFHELLTPEEQENLPDSVVLHTGGKLYTRSRAVAEVLLRLGGLWGCVGWVMQLLPTTVLDWAYDRVASIRQRLFTSPKTGGCPILPQELRPRFLV